jgi:hypothetical protein
LTCLVFFFLSYTLHYLPADHSVLSLTLSSGLALLASQLLLPASQATTHHSLLMLHYLLWSLTFLGGGLAMMYFAS